MPNARRLHFAIGVICICLLAACTAPAAAPPATPRVVYVPVSATPPPALTAVPTQTAAPTQTPTPTAAPAVVIGSAFTPPASTPAGTPAAQPGAPCGVADWLDFPVAPPDAEGARIVLRFGVAGGVGKGSLHAGDDFLLPGGSLGKPVYAIGNGEVLYSEPLGWGADKGTVIVRHVFAGGTSVLSFYGHLDPPSVTRRAGECVARGDVLGAIGKPRTPPHLHFEIRTIMPYQPGPGYWPVDPSVAGWLPPSAYIQYRRMAAAPGVLWILPFSTARSQVLGPLDGSAFVVLSGDVLSALDAGDGHTLWRKPLAAALQAAAPQAAALDARGTQVYLARADGTLDAIGVPSGKLAWSARPDITGTRVLQPLGTGGVLVLGSAPAAQSARLTALSADGQTLWTQDIAVEPAWRPAQEQWANAPGALLMADISRPRAWVMNASGAQPWGAPLDGRPLAAGGQVLVHNREGIYRMDAALGSAELLYALPRAYGELGDMLVLPDGTLLFTHQDLRDARLIALYPDGRLRWERSYYRQLPGEARLFLVDGRPYLLMHETLRSSASRVTLYAVDAQEATLARLFSGSGDFALPGQVQLYAAGENALLLNVDGHTLLTIEP